MITRDTSALRIRVVPREALRYAYRARCTERPAWKKTLDAYRERVEAA